MHSRNGLIPQQITVALSERISYLVKSDPGYLAERPDLDLIDFQSGKEIFRRAVELGKDVQGLSLELIPLRSREQLYEVLDDLVGGLRRIELFTPPEDAATATQERDALLFDVEGQYERAFNCIAPYLGYLQLKSAQVHESTRKSAELLQLSVRQVTTSLDELATKLKELDRILEARRKEEAERPAPKPVLRGYTDEQVSHQWFWFLIIASGVIAGLIWIGTVIYHWGDYRPSGQLPTGQFFAASVRPARTLIPAG